MTKKPGTESVPRYSFGWLDPRGLFGLRTKPAEFVSAFIRERFVFPILLENPKKEQ